MEISPETDLKGIATSGSPGHHPRSKDSKVVSKISIDTQTETRSIAHQKPPKDWRVIGYTDWMADVNHGMIRTDLEGRYPRATKILLRACPPAGFSSAIAALNRRLEAGAAERATLREFREFVKLVPK